MKYNANININDYDMFCVKIICNMFIHKKQNALVGPLHPPNKFLHFKMKKDWNNIYFIKNNIIINIVSQNNECIYLIQNR